jgi:hypothetical protein
MKTETFRKRSHLKTLIFILTGLLISQLAYTQGWHDVSWPFRRAISVSNSNGSDLVDFQVRIIIKDNEFDFNTAIPDGSDIRLAASDGTTLLPFWIESWVPGDSATIWVKIPLIPVAGTEVYLYYGNSHASGTGSGQATFEFFDDFEDWNNVPPNSGWTELAPVPVASADVAVASYNGRFYAFGGYGINHVVQNTVNEYDPLTNQWTPKTAMPTNRWGMMAVEFDGLIYVFGGQGTSAATGVVEVYNPATDSWTSRANLPATISFQGLMAIRFGERIHLFYRSYHYEYDPASDSYTQRNNVPYPRTWGTCALVDSRIYIIGGHDGTGGTNTNQVLDPVTDTWTHETPLPVTLYGATRENPVINGKIYVTHGWDDDYFFTTNYVYDPETDLWSQRGSATYPRDGVGCTVIDSKLYVIGGRNVPSNTYGLTYHEVYDPMSDTWESQTGSQQWETSEDEYVYTASEAGYQGGNGLVVEQPMDGSTQAFRSAETAVGFGAVYAVDFNWNVTDIGGIAESPANPQGMVRLTDATTSYGSLYFYQYLTQPSVRWYTGSWTDIRNSTWNSWHNVTIVRNGAASRVTFDGISYAPLSIATGGSGRVRFGVLRSTQYIDNVRVRKWAGSDPVATIGSEEHHSTAWTGLISNDWNNPGNWTAGVPGSGSIISVPAVTSAILVNGSLTLGSLSEMVLEPGGAVTVTGDLVNNGTVAIGSSLVSSGSLIVNGTSTGNISYNRQLKTGSVAGSDWHLAAPPVTANSAANDGKITTVYQWSEPSGLWTSTGITSAVAGRGYNINQEPSSDGVITFTGPLANGNVTYDASSPFAEADGADVSYFDRTYVAGRSPENPGGRGWNLLGNPYPSAISAEDFILANYSASPGQSQFDPNHVALYLFDGTTRGYYYIARSTGWPSGTELGETHIQAGQGFFAMAMSDNSVFTFTKAMQEHSTVTPMLKSGKSDDRWPGLQLKVKYASGEVVTTVVYEGSMTTGVDPGYDIGLFKSGQDMELYTLLALKDNGINYTRQALPLSGADTLALPVGVDFKKGGEVTFSAVTVPVDGRRFWLSDKVTGTFTELGLKSYTVTLPADTYGTGRFYIIASANTPTDMRDPGASGDNLRIWVSGDRIIIRGNVSEGSLCGVYDIGGRRLAEVRMSDREMNTVDLPAGISGVIVVKVTDGGVAVTRKVVVP